jgi:hypothetical protein
MKDNNNNNNTPWVANLATTSKQDEDGSFKSVSRRKTGNAPRTRVHTIPDGTKTVDVSMTKTFQVFHKEQTPIITKLVADPTHQGHALVQRWNKVQQGKPKIAKVTTFRTISELLNLNDIRE